MTDAKTEPAEDRAIREERAGANPAICSPAICNPACGNKVQCRAYRACSFNFGIQVHSTSIALPGSPLRVFRLQGIA